MAPEYKHAEYIHLKLRYLQSNQLTIKKIFKIIIRERYRFNTFDHRFE
jgi:hypothetical protein